MKRRRFPQCTFSLALPMSYTGGTKSSVGTTTSVSSTQITFRDSGTFPAPPICTIKIAWPYRLDGTVKLNLCAQVRLDPKSEDGLIVAHIRRWWVATAGGRN